MLNLEYVMLWDGTKVSDWLPPDPDSIFKVIDVLVSYGDEPGTMTLKVLVTTPKALGAAQGGDGILYAGRLVMVKTWDWGVLEAWLMNVLEECNDVDWDSSLQRLRKYFSHEFENYRE